MPPVDKRYVISAFQQNDSNRMLPDPPITVGKLLGSASVKQAYHVELRSGKQGAFKFVKPSAHVDIGDPEGKQGYFGVLDKTLSSNEITHKYGRVSESLKEAVHKTVRKELSISSEVEYQKQIGDYIRNKGYSSDKSKEYGKWCLVVPEVIANDDQWFADKGSTALECMFNGDSDEETIEAIKVMISNKNLTFDKTISQLNKLLAENEISLKGEFEVLFKLFDTPSYIFNNGSLSPKDKKHVIIKILGISRLFGF